MMQTRIQANPPAVRAGLRQAIAGEWTKLYSVRSTVWTVVAMAAATVGIAVLVAATGSLHPDDSILAASLGNAVPGQIAAGALGALVICGEYSSGTIRATLAACPRRLTVLAAKTLLAGTIGFGVALAAAGGSYLASTLLLSGQGHPPGQPIPALAGIALCYAMVAVIGVAAGTALRHTAAAVLTVTGLLVLPTLVGPLLGSWQRPVVGVSPAGALQKLAQSTDTTPQTTGGLAAWPTLWLVCAYSLAALAAAGALLQRRDT